MITEKYDGGEGESTDGEFESLKIAVDTRIRNTVLEDCREGEGKYGKYVIVFMHTVDGEKVSTLVGLPDSSGKGSTVFNRQFVSTFLVKGDDSFWHVKPAYADKPVWIGKVEKKSKSGTSYHDMEWGWETQQAEVQASDLKYSSMIAIYYGDGVDQITAAKKLSGECQISPMDAMGCVKAYYDWRSTSE